MRPIQNLVIRPYVQLRTRLYLVRKGSTYEKENTVCALGLTRNGYQQFSQTSWGMTSRENENRRKCGHSGLASFARDTKLPHGGREGVRTGQIPFARRNSTADATREVPPPSPPLWPRGQAGLRQTLRLSATYAPRRGEMRLNFGVAYTF